ncbi:hypothetical protein CDD82_5491 [Ophiocordyceps australis]|uniref:Cytochrome P450 n=1 Tax=Ophiocordyceps australis TaxID=1399860 RepID=A0A2C5Y5P6_9HYPO|nr:hypothetical protein CDD82_5491 [Ophiocordyceps australis]
MFGKPRDVSLADNYVRWATQCSDVAPFTLISRLRKETQELDEVDMAAECLDHMVAGIDTTGDTLCFLMWELSQPRSMQYQRKLSEELRYDSTSPVDQLPFLDAVVNEALRCFPAIPMSLPRVVPQGGRIIHGLRIPEQTVVSSQPFSIHKMNSDIFPEPATFNPYRWLVSHGDVERRRHLFAFSIGGRGCIGRHLAMMEMKMLLREVYRDFSTYPDPSMSQESMAAADQLISTQPRGRRCLLHFHPRADV